MWIRTFTGEIAEVLGVPPGCEPLYACLPHLRLARVYSVGSPDGELADVDIEQSRPLDGEELEAARAAGWAP